MTTIKAGDLPQTISLPEGQALTITGAANTTGVAYLLDLVLGGTNSLRSWAIGAGALPQIGPYAGAQKVQIVCSAGSIEATVGDAVIGSAQLVVDDFGASGGLVVGGKQMGDVIHGFVGADKPTMIWVYDHPTRQLLPGNATSESVYDSYHQYFKDMGLYPYSLTTCTRTDYSKPSAPGNDNPDFLSWAAVKSLQQEGVEITNHSVRHLSNLARICSGFQIRYLGGDATATAYVTDAPRTLKIVSATAGTTSFDLTSAACDTLAELKAAVEAVAGWQMTLAVELDGTERSADMLIVATPGKNCKGAGALMAMSGGLLVRYKGSSYRNAFVNVLAGSPNYLQFWGDGVLVAEFALNNSSYDTLAEVAAAGSALDSGDWEVLVMDDILSANNLPYCDGTEASQGNLPVSNARDCYHQHVWLSCGIPVIQIWRKLLKGARDDAAAYGVRMQNFSDVGGGAYSSVMQQIPELSNMPRCTGDKVSAAPGAIPAYAAAMFTTYTYDVNTTSKTDAQAAAVPAALGDSPGHMVSMFLHQLDNLDGSTGRRFLPRNPAVSNAYWNEAGMAGFATGIKALVDKRGLNRLTQQGFYEARGRFSPPPNFIFNPRWKNSGNPATGTEALAGISSTDLGARIPGWRISTPGITAIAIDGDGNMTLTSNAATNSAYFQAQVWLEPGKTYNVGLLAETLAYSSGVGITLNLAPMAGYEYLSEIASFGQGIAFDEAAGSAAGVHKSWNENLTVPLPVRKTAMVRARTGTTKDLSVNKYIKLNFDSIGATGDIDCSAGAASASAVYAYEMAAAINAAMKASATYAGKSEYHNCARAENGRLIIESPYKSYSTTTSAKINVTNGSTASAATTIFGTSGGTSQPIGRFSTSGQQTLLPYFFTISIAAAGTFRLSSPRVKMIEGIL